MPNVATSDRRAISLVELLAVLAIIGTLLSLLLPAIVAARESGRRLACTNNVRQLAAATNNHLGVRQSFPRHPWSLSIMPFLEPTNETQEVLLSRIDELAAQQRGPLFCPSVDSMDPETGWFRASYAMNGHLLNLRPQQVRDGLSKTLLFCELMPEVREFWVFGPLLNIDSTFEGKSAHMEGYVAAMCDGSAQFVHSDELSRTNLSRLLNPSDGK